MERVCFAEPVQDVKTEKIFKRTGLLCAAVIQQGRGFRMLSGGDLQEFPETAAACVADL